MSGTSAGRIRSARTARAGLSPVRRRGAGSRSPDDAATWLEHATRIELGLDAAHEEQTWRVAGAPCPDARAEPFRPALDPRAPAADARPGQESVGGGDLARPVGIDLDANDRARR